MADAPAPKPDKTLDVTVRTPAGVPASFEFKDNTRIDKVIRVAVEHFVAEDQLAPDGRYGLILVRDGAATELADAGRLDDYDVIDGDELHLVNRDPQVDG